MNKIDTSNCETEPIRFPGAVMPHGALLVLQGTSGIIEAASESCSALFGLSPESLLGRNFGNVFGRQVEAAL
ncbi:hypothetical protein [Propionivibrio sp.]|uniref:hypothetical protein n=1 Tax=Propionivibrio sp. TaxID=2212460 RepID=UPI003BEFBFB7